MKLPQSRLATDGARRVFAALDAEGGHVRVVGGAVRDALLDLPVSDIDLATDWLPQQVIERLEAAGIKAVPTGIAHGTVTAVADGEVIEVTTLRRDVTTDGRHAQVAFSDDWQQDAARRDFTINALYADPLTLEISDFFGGLADLEQRKVRFIGDASTRIAEDHLRILRFFRFHARFGRGAPDAVGLAACAARANDLMSLSRERIRDELSKLLVVANPVPVVVAMIDAGIMGPILPEARDVDRLARLVAMEAARDVPASWLRRLAALLPADAVLLEAVGARYKLSNFDRRRLKAMAAPAGEDARADAYWHNLDTAIDRLLLGGAGPERFARLDGWTRPALPASGRALIARGLAPGPEVSRKLSWVEAQWVAAGFPSDVTPLLERAMTEG